MSLDSTRLLTLKAIEKDVLAIFKDPPPGIMVLQDKYIGSKIHALIKGQAGTPYEGGFFYLIFWVSGYPIICPKVVFMTHNNVLPCKSYLYSNSCVLLRILGNVLSSGWSPAMNLSTLLISIQSILNEKPYHNVLKKERNPGDVEKYNQTIQHETVRITVCNLLEKKISCPDGFYKSICSSFLDNCEFYTNICKKNMHLDGQTMFDPFHQTDRKFCYENILDRLEKLKSTISSLVREKSTDGDGDDDDSIYESDDDYDVVKDNPDAAEFKDIPSSSDHNPAGQF